MPSAEIITIGTELLLGEIVDTNARYIALQLRNAGIDLYRKTTVGDNPQRIAQAVQQAMQSNQIVITTGGLGPTVDDPTREAIALAVGVEVEFRPELWDQIKSRFRRFGREPTDNNRRQAYVPQGALAIENPVGTAPSFIVEHSEHSIIALPGVPREMEHLILNAVLPYLRERYDLHGLIKTRILHTSGVGESQIDDRIGDLEKLSNPTIGLSAHTGQVDIRITAKATSESEADQLIHKAEQEIRQRLGSWIYGVDNDTLEFMALEALEEHKWQLAVVECCMEGNLIQRLSAASQADKFASKQIFRGGELVAKQPEPEELDALVKDYRSSRQVDVCLGIAIYPQPENQDVHILLITPQQTRVFNRPFGGPPGNAPIWAANHSLDILRKL